MIESLKYENEDGNIQNHDVTVYALSTCGFCRKGLSFLRDNSIKFKYIYVDKLDYDSKQQVKSELQEKYQQRVVFPYLVLDQSKVYLGFIEDQWKEAFNLL